jgi:hypothetical protein
MMAIQSVLYAALLFPALAFLLRWKHVRQSKGIRLQRSLRLYLSGGFSATQLETV